MNLPEKELEVLEWWKQEKVFEKSVDKPSPKGDFVFYEGPPTANGRPGIHHVISRQFKDIIPRFKTMQGYRVVRKGGWDTHGLPVELEVEKQLGLKNKKEVEAYGIAAFNKKCRESVWKYKEDWEKFTERIAYWLDIKNPYITYEGSYVNGLWAVIKKFWERGLLIEGHKVVPHCPRCGTALSSHELAQGYSTVKDLSLTVKFQITSQRPFRMTVGKGSKVYILSWTTTPWTLPGNVALAVGKEIEYVIVKVVPLRHPERPRPSGGVEGSLSGGQSDSGGIPRQARNDGDEFEYLILAKERLSIVEGEYEVVKEMKGNELVGLEYEPLFDIPTLKSPTSYKVYPADFVSTADGTGVVHTAVMYGEDDYQLGTQVGLPKVHTVAEDGTFINHKSQITNHKQHLNSKFQIPNSENIMERLAGKFVKDPETERLIIEDLDKRGLIFNRELYEHDYPFCWRCKTPLLYYAKHSWFVAMSKLRNELIEANNQINWVPGYIKEGRFGEWLREVKDWAFSRERYWGTPLPIWQCEKGCGRTEVIGSVAELVQKSKLKNRYIFMRHGESLLNLKEMMASTPESAEKFPLSELGKQQVVDAVERLQREKISRIIASDLRRTRETAELIARPFGLTVEYDQRLRDTNVGVLEDGSYPEYKRRYADVRARFFTAPEGGETYGDILKRTLAFVHDCEARSEGATILVVSHGDPLVLIMWALGGGMGAPKMELKHADPIVVDHGVFLTDERGELDLHRPRVDEVEFPCACGGVMRRVPEVADVWFDSGAMPFVQYEENIEVLKNTPPDPSQEGNQLKSPPREGWPKAGVGSPVLKQFPADYIAEAIDQTRGWFYTLLAVSVALGKGAPYKNVICLGHILDAKGKKMSKSLGNIVVPGEMFEKYGVDAVRWYLFTMNDPGLPKRFNEKELQEVVKKFFMILWNIVSFHELYSPNNSEHSDLKAIRIYELHSNANSGYSDRPFMLNSPNATKHILDKWILARLNQLTKLVTERLEAYDITPAGRALQEFVTDLSTWYVRRSRERMRGGMDTKSQITNHHRHSGIPLGRDKSQNDSEDARVTLRYVLVELSKLMAPFVPFTADALWQRVGKAQSQEGTESESGEVVNQHSNIRTNVGTTNSSDASVHLSDWPRAEEVDVEVLGAMETVRKIVEVGLAARAGAKMPIRQPLKSARIRNYELGMKDEYLDILKDELNVKEVIIEKGQGELAVELDTVLTDKLKLEGMKRELIRAVNNLRKEAKLTIKDKIVWELQKLPVTEKLLNAYRDELLTATIASEIHLASTLGVSKKGAVKLGDEAVGFGFDR